MTQGSNEMGRTDMTTMVILSEGTATVSVVLEPPTTECVSTYAATSADFNKALDRIRQSFLPFDRA